ncbi:MAG: hypothetical protein ABI543_10095 [Ignavibacteria bacterium]
MEYRNQLNTLKTLFLISGILNLICAIVWLGNTILGAVAFCGLGCVIGIFPVINTIACVLDFMVYNRLNKMNKTGTYSTIRFAAIFDIISIVTCNITSLVFGIIALVMIGKPEVKQEMVNRGIY